MQVSNYLIAFKIKLTNSVYTNYMKEVARVCSFQRMTLKMHETFVATFDERILIDLSDFCDLTYLILNEDSITQFAAYKKLQME